MSPSREIILAAHGAGSESSANAQIASCATHLAATLPNVDVTAAFHLGTPTLTDVLERSEADERLIIPMLSSDGYFAELIRREAQNYPARRGRTSIASPIGTHPVLIDTVVDDVRDALAARMGSSGFTDILVVGHGTRRHPDSRQATHHAARRIARVTELPVHAAFLDDSPSPEEAIARLSLNPVLLVIPFFLGGGTHVATDLPDRVGRAIAQRGGDPRCAEFRTPLGEFPQIGRLLAQIVREADGHHRRLTVGARASLLSRRQVDLVALAVAPFGIDLQFVPIDTEGDLDRSTPIGEFASGDPFTGAITEALASGQIDLAVHSLKDLPLRNPPFVVDVAYLPRASSHEVLVARPGEAIPADLAGMRIGTSCARRARQIRSRFPFSFPVTIRGDVPARIALVDQGEVDAVVLAAAGLERLGLEHRVTRAFAPHDLLPAAGQGAIVIQCRSGHPDRSLLAAVDDPATRRAVATERAFARQMANAAPHAVVAALAHAQDARITLHARLIHPDTGEERTITVHGPRPDQVASTATDHLRPGQPVPRPTRTSS